MISLGSTVSTDLASIACGRVFIVRDVWSEHHDVPTLTVGLRIAPQQQGALFLWFQKDKVQLGSQLPPTQPVLDIGRLAIRIPDLLNSLTVAVSEGKPGNLALQAATQYLIVSLPGGSGETWIDLDSGQGASPKGQPQPWYVTHWQMGIEDGRGNFECLSEIRRPRDKPSSGNRPPYSIT